MRMAKITCLIVVLLVLIPVRIGCQEIKSIQVEFRRDFSQLVDGGDRTIAGCKIRRGYKRVVPSTTEISRISERFAEATRQ